MYASCFFLPEKAIIISGINNKWKGGFNVQHTLQLMNPLSNLLLNSSRGPLASMHALDVMWISFYSIGLLLVSILIITATRKWVHNMVLSFLLKLVAYVMFFIGTLLMVLVVLTWPN